MVNLTNVPIVSSAKISGTYTISGSTLTITSTYAEEDASITLNDASYDGSSTIAATVASVSPSLLEMVLPPDTQLTLKKS